MVETSAERRARKEKARLAKLEKTRVRSRATVPGRGRGRPRLSDAERAAVAEKRQERAAKALCAKQKERRQAARRSLAFELQSPQPQL